MRREANDEPPCEIERVQGPVWPNGSMEYKVRLFAEGGTVVEQYF
ncbi:MAG TPA: hypothetical protein VFP67_03215 [Acidimicrobiia bacterium]|nr:hypothetical protein [Acidimicrobiia bacterium]